MSKLPYEKDLPPIEPYKEPPRKRLTESEHSFYLGNLEARIAVAKEAICNAQIVANELSKGSMIDLSLKAIEDVILRLQKELDATVKNTLKGRY